MELTRRATRRQPEPTLARLPERRSLMKFLLTLPDMAEQRESLCICITSLETKIRDKMRSDLTCWTIKESEECLGH